MGTLPIDRMEDAGVWTALAAESDDASEELTVAAAPGVVRPGGSGQSLRLASTAAAEGHRLRRTLAPALDLGERDDLRFWLRSDRSASGSEASPYFLELRLGSAARPVDAPANPWHRLIPVAGRDRWEMVRVGIDDLPDEVRGAVGMLQVRVVDGSVPFELHLDDLIAGREEMLSDAEAAFRDALHEKVRVGDEPVGAFVSPEEPDAADEPHFRILLRDLEAAPGRTPATRSRGDFTRQGFRLRPPIAAFDLRFEIDARAPQRAVRNRLLEFALRSLARQGTLEVNGVGRSLRFEGTVPVAERPAGNGPLPALRFSLSTWLEVGVPEVVVPPFERVEVTVEDRSAVPA